MNRKFPRLLFNLKTTLFAFPTKRFNRPHRLAAAAIPAVGGEQGPSNVDVRPLPPRSSLPRKKKTTPSAKTTVAERYRKSLGKLIGTGTPATRPLFG
jgi:hypothetical protein